MYPKMKRLPTLDSPEIDVHNHVQFPCKIHYKLGDPNVRFQVQWTAGGHVVSDPHTGQPLSTVLQGDQRLAYLDANALQGHLGTNVSDILTNTDIISSSV